MEMASLLDLGVVFGAASGPSSRRRGAARAEHGQCTGITMPPHPTVIIREVHRDESVVPAPTVERDHFGALLESKQIVAWLPLGSSVRSERSWERSKREQIVAGSRARCLIGEEFNRFRSSATRSHFSDSDAANCGWECVACLRFRVVRRK